MVVHHEVDILINPHHCSAGQLQDAVWSCGTCGFPFLAFVAIHAYIRSGRSCALLLSPLTWVRRRRGTRSLSGRSLGMCMCAWGWGRAAWRSNDLDDGARAAAPTHPLPTPVQHCLGPRALIQRLLVGNRNKDADRWRGEAISRALMW